MAITLRDWMLGNKNDMNLDDEFEIVRNKNEALSARAADMSTQLEAEEMQPGKRRKRQVENWLKNVEELQPEVEYLQQEVRSGAFSSRKMLKRTIVDLTREIDDLMEQGRFPGGLTLDDHACSTLPLVTTELKGRMFKENLEMILSWLANEDVCRIGVYGLGGVGKTALAMHIHNKLLEDDKTDVHIYWVTVSQEMSVATLQNKIAKAAKLEHVLEGESDQIKRAAMLSAALKKRKRVVLFLDDIWKHFQVESLGVPVGKHGCKLIITSRSLDVCRRMECQRRVKVEPLSEKESWELFSGKLGNVEDLSLDVKDVAKLVAKRCAGLPLGILTIAGSMREVIDIHEWNNTLEELTDSTRRHEDIENDVFPLLELSYARLNDMKIQKCFLDCAFYPEDSKLSRVELINLWISDSLFEDIESREKQLHKGHAVLNRLINASLLDSLDSKGRYVKMHDLIRDMAMKIARDTHHIMIKSGLQLSSVPDEKEWTEDLLKVSLISNHISDVAYQVSPVCPNLLTLLLQDNPLKSVPDLFFSHMKGLRFLSITQAPIKELPVSISELENLSALVVNCCTNLIYVPSLTKLKKLRELNLQYNDSLEKVPQGIEMLPNLRFLNLGDCKKLCMPLHNLIAGLSCIEHLNIDLGIKDVTGKDLMMLPHLKRLECCWMSNVGDFNSYIKSQHFHQLNYYRFFISSADSAYRSVIGDIYDKNVVIYKYGTNQACGIEPLLLPDNIEFLEVCQVNSNIKSLPDVLPSLLGLKKLARIWIGYCQGLSYVWPSTSSSVVELTSLEELNLSELDNLRGIIEAEIPGVAFDNLKKLTMHYCSEIKALFTPSVLSHLCNLEVLEVQVCVGLQEIISLSDIHEDTEGEHNEVLPIVNNQDNNNNAAIYLTKLRVLQLLFLPNVRSICSKGLLGCDHIEYITIIQCPSLRKLPFSFTLNDGQPSDGSISLPKMIVEKEWWDTLEWDHPNSAHLLLPHIEYC